jgi:hypothetical protein
LKILKKKKQIEKKNKLKKTKLGVIVRENKERKRKGKISKARNSKQK